MRRKWHAPWKAILKADEHRTETQTALDAAKQELAGSEKSYEAIAKQAEGFAGAGAGAKHERRRRMHGGRRQADRTALGSHVRAQVAGADHRREVPVPRITGADFPVLTASGFWDELKGGTAEQAIERLNSASAGTTATSTSAASRSAA